MKTASTWTLGALALAVCAGAGYWLGTRQAASTAPTPALAAAPAASAAPTPPRKLLYYRNPMGLPDTSPTPKKDSMGMDYIAVYEGEDTPSAAGVGISTEKVQKLGVRTEAVALRALDAVLRASARIETDERRVYTIAPKFEGYVERLLINATGQSVSKGQALFEVYSPDLVSAQREYLVASQGLATLKDAPTSAQASMQQLADAAALRLKNWDLSDAQIQRLRSSGQAQRSVSFYSPVSGIVTEKKAQQGMRFMPGEALYQVADLSSVWVIADVAEQDLAQVRNGSLASVRINAYPDKRFNGRVSYVYPNLTRETRSVGVRIELPNPQGLLKPGMFAQVEIAAPGTAATLTVPQSAVLESGTRSVVLVQSQPGRFEPRTVVLGRRSDSYVQVLQGLSAGEQVVVSANFLIDAESNLKAALQGLSAAPGNPAAPSSAPATPSAAKVGYHAEGKLDSVDAASQSVTITHGPIAALKWPGMTMEFKLANGNLAQGLQPGQSLSFDFVERARGEWVITAVQSPRAAR